MGYELFAGYYEDELNTKNSFIDGYFISNDIGYFDENALFYFFSRNKDLIKINGENISSLEIENLLSSHKKINNASVICISDALVCDKIIAFLELKDYPYEEEVNILQKNKELKQIEKELIALNLHLAKFKQVSEFIFLNHLPRNYLGKVRKNVLGEIYGRN
ncbi:TPA: AMP-binding enzyme [Campylobacter jejuni]